MTNKLIFNEGGQPVFLDDLSVIQDSIREATEELLSSLGADLTQDVLFIKKPSVTRSGTTATFSSGVLWHNIYGMIPITGVIGLDLGATGRAFVKIIITNSEYRTFDDGQQHACRRCVTATIVNLSGPDCYAFSEIGDLISSLSALLDKSNKSNFTSVDVDWVNGYRGVVEFKYILGGYRYHVQADSMSGSWADENKFICLGDFHPAVSPMFLTGGDTAARDNPHFLILNGEGFMALSGGTELGPSTAPIDITFDVLTDSRIY